LSCSITFVGPVQGESTFNREILRQGKSVTTLEVRLWQENVQSILIASFGTDRESSIHVRQEPVIPAYPLADQLAPLPFAKMMPECYQHFDLRWAEGNFQ
jgi:acyl-CoA thioesterase